MTSPARNLFTAVVVAVFLVVNVVAIKWSSGFFRSNSKPTLLKYGSHITRLEGQRLVGTSSVEPATNRLNLVLYFYSTEAPGLAVELFKYASLGIKRSPMASITG